MEVRNAITEHARDVSLPTEGTIEPEREARGLQQGFKRGGSPFARGAPQEADQSEAEGVFRGRRGVGSALPTLVSEARSA